MSGVRDPRAFPPPGSERYWQLREESRALALASSASPSTSKTGGHTASPAHSPRASPATGRTVSNLSPASTSPPSRELVPYCVPSAQPVKRAWAKNEAKLKGIIAASVDEAVQQWEAGFMAKLKRLDDRYAALAAALRELREENNAWLAEMNARLAEMDAPLAEMKRQLKEEVARNKRGRVVCELTESLLTYLAMVGRAVPPKTDEGPWEKMNEWRKKLALRDRVLSSVRSGQRPPTIDLYTWEVVSTIVPLYLALREVSNSCANGELDLDSLKATLLDLHGHGVRLEGYLADGVGEVTANSVVDMLRGAPSEW
ncbi:hypothetical protein IAT38_000106 [Cryptococcus sp. DSM 104549]